MIGVEPDCNERAVIITENQPKAVDLGICNEYVGNCNDALRCNWVVNLAKPIAQSDLASIEALLKGRPDGLSIRDLVGTGATDAQRRSMQRRLKKLIDSGRVRSEGATKGARYHWAGANPSPASDDHTAKNDDGDALVPISAEGRVVLAILDRPSVQRNPVGYNRDFLSSYLPNKTFFLPERAREHLARIGATGPEQPAGTYARGILDRLLIDLAWNSSRLEGNTYSILDTHVLLERGKTAEGKSAEETQMILNHKEAIEYLVDIANEGAFNRSTILNLHALLSNNLLPDPMAEGRLRRGIVGIGNSVYAPLQNLQLIDECFGELLGKAHSITDPFEQSLFVCIQLPYLQPFEDVNKRVSRLAANIPFIKHNLSPISFIDVPQDAYVNAMLAVYELNAVEPIRDVFVWAYERSARRYAAFRQSLGQPDAFRLKYRDELTKVVSDVIRMRLAKPSASHRIREFAHSEIPPADRQRFVEMAEIELLNLHEGNFARYKVRPSEFYNWKAQWEAD